MKFKNFVNDDNIKKSKLKIDLGLLIGEEYDGIESNIEIINNEIVFDIIDKQYYSESELKHIGNILSNINWDNGYEYCEFWDDETNTTFYIEADKNSKVFEELNKSDNSKLLDNTLNVLKQK